MQHRIVVLLCVMLLLARPALAAPLSPTAAVGNDTSFGGTTPWVNPTNILTSNNTYTTAAAKGSSCGGPTSYQTLRASGFGAAVPAAATVVGISVSLEGQASHSDCGFQVDSNTWTVTLGKGGVLIGATSNGHTGSTESGWCFAPATDTICVVGGAGDRWGQTWTPAEVNAAGFSVGVTLFGNNSSISLDHLTVTLTHVFAGKAFVTKHRPSRWEPLNSPEWWVGTGVTMVSAWTDAKSTEISKRRCPYPLCAEAGGPFLGPNPSTARVYGVTLSLAALRRVAVALIWRRNRQAGRFVSWAEAGGSALGHGLAARQNLGLRP